MSLQIEGQIISVQPPASGAQRGGDADTEERMLKQLRGAIERPLTHLLRYVVPPSKEYWEAHPKPPRRMITDGVVGTGEDTERRIGDHAPATLCPRQLPSGVPPVRGRRACEQLREAPQCLIVGREFVQTSWFSADLSECVVVP